MEIKGKVVQVLPMEGGISRNGNQWSKASLIVEVAENPQFPKKIKISNMKNADAFSKIALGSDITFKVDVESREYNGRWYTEVSCYSWDNAAPELPKQQGFKGTYQQSSGQSFGPSAVVPQDDDGLPF